jgi:hypothetical protein
MVPIISNWQNNLLGNNPLAALSARGERRKKMEIQEFKNKVNAIGAILKMSVQFPSEEDMRWNRWAHLTKDHQKIRMSNGDYQNEHKFHIAGDFPTSIKGESGRYGEPISINVSDSKAPEQIARDIEKRLLPIYLPELAKAVDQVNSTNLFHQRRTANIQKMAEYFGVEFKDDEREPSIYVYDLIKGLGSRINVCGEDRIKFELELTPEMAINVFDLLKQ